MKKAGSTEPAFVSKRARGYMNSFRSCGMPA